MVKDVFKSASALLESKTLDLENIIHLRFPFQYIQRVLEFKYLIKAARVLIGFGMQRSKARATSIKFSINIIRKFLIRPQ